MKILRAAILLAPVCCMAQLQLYVAPVGGQESPVNGIYQIGQAYVSESWPTRFRIRNEGTVSVTLTTLNVAGAGFKMTGQPSLPHIVAPGTNVDFTITFRPTDYGYYSANLQINSTGVILRANGMLSASFFVEGQGIETGSTVDFGRVERGSGRSLDMVVKNTTREPVAVSSVIISGGVFSLPFGNPAPLLIEPGQQAMFTMRFTPAAAQIYTGTLTIDRHRVIQLTATGVEPPMPRPSVVVATPVVRSGEQGRLSIRFATVSRARGRGQIRMELRPGGGAKDNDAAAQFATGGRTAIFEVLEGKDTAWFENGRTEIVFQAGTTAGTLIFTAEAGGFTELASITVDPEPVRLEKSTAARNGSALEVQLTGFDNTRTVSNLVFTFYDGTGQAIAGSPVRVAATESFARWWEASTLGGVFSLRASFPVTGDVSQVKSVEVEVVNASGTARTDRLNY